MKISAFSLGESPLSSNHTTDMNRLEQTNTGYSIERHKEGERRQRRAGSKGTPAGRLVWLFCFIGALTSVVVLAFGVQASDHHFAPDHSPPTIALNQQQQQQQLRTAATDSDEKLKRVFVCLKEPFTSHLVDGPCTFGNASIIVGQQDSSNSQTDSPGPAAVGEQQQQGSLLTNIVRIPITFKWTKSFTIILSVEEPTTTTTTTSVRTNAAGSLLAEHSTASASDNQLPHRRLAQQQQQQPPQPSNGSSAGEHAIAAASGSNNESSNISQRQQLADRHVLTESEVIPDLEANLNKPWTFRWSRGLKSSLAYRFRLYCTSNYHGDGCNTFCRPRDDQFGHYKCSPSGQKVCLEGWQGQENNCLQAKCRPGCQTNQCDSPNGCRCRAGWTGPRCDQCLTYPGCQNGYCLAPGQCLCHQNWGGVLCDQDLNYCSTHEPCKNNATCQNVAPGRYKCNNCPEGFTGLNCDLAAAGSADPAGASPQQHQLTAGCALNPCLNGGVCYGFDADKLTTLSPSANSNKTLPTTTTTTASQRRYYRCQCAGGWTGDYCQWQDSGQLSPKISTIISGPNLNLPADNETTTTTTGRENNSTEGSMTNDYDASDADLMSANNTGGGQQMAMDLVTDPAEEEMHSSRVVTPILEIPPPLGTTATATATTATASTVDMRHIISGVVIASAVGVFMASLLLAWCCLAAFERNGFSFIQMNIIQRTSGSSSSTASGEAEPAAACRATLRRVQEKIRNSFRGCSSSGPKRRQIKPETKLSIENVLRPPPSYEESKYNAHVGFAEVLVDSANQRRAQLEVEKEKPTQGSSSNLVIRGAIEQKLLQATRASNKYRQQQTTSCANQNQNQHPKPKANHQSPEEEQQQQQRKRHISAGQMSCPKHGHLLYHHKNRQQQAIRQNLTERDLRVSYPHSTNEIVIRAEDLYEDHSAALR